MPLLSESFLEMVLLAAVPDVAGAHTAAGPTVQAYRSPAHAVIGAAVDDARRTGRRAAVCVIDLPRPVAGERDGQAPVEADVIRTLRRGDQAVRLDDAIVVVAPALDHPAAADRLADRLRAAASRARGAVGMAVYPVHGGDAAALLDSARASALRARLGRGWFDADSGPERRAVS